MIPSNSNDLVSTFNALLFAALVISGLAVEHASRSNVARKMETEQTSGKPADQILPTATGETGGDHKEPSVKPDSVVNHGSH